MRVPAALLAGFGLLLLVPRSAPATITFTQLDDDVFSVSHRVKGIGSRGKATRMVYTKAASLCMAAGFSHYRILDQESQAGQQYEAANATVRVKFFFEDGEDRIDCRPGSEGDYVHEARNKLRRAGYTPPTREVAPEDSTGTQSTEQGGHCPGSCTIEQIAAMARAGLTDERIRAACKEASDN